MNRIAAALLLALSLPFTAHADEASHRAKAQEFMTILRTREMVERNADGLRSQLTAAAGNIIGPNPSPSAKADADDFIKQGNQLIDSKLGWDAMQSAITDIYVKNFTEDQLDGILAFYKSPVGTAMLTNVATISTQVAALGSERLGPELRPQLMQLLNAFRAKESGTPTQAPAAGTPPPAIPPAVAAPLAPSPAK